MYWDGVLDPPALLRDPDPYPAYVLGSPGNPEKEKAFWVGIFSTGQGDFTLFDN